MPALFDLNEITSLMPMPISSVRMAEMVSDPGSTIQQFTRVIELDQALTVDILRWANSAFSGPETRIDTVRDAVVRLGTANILKLAVGQHLVASFSPSLSQTDYGENELWRHSVASALAVEGLSEISPVRIPGLGFTAALIHDVGKLILCRRLGYDNLQEMIREIVDEKNVSGVEAERTFLQTDHAEIGGAIVRHWKFSEEMAGAIENHHRHDMEGGVLLDAVVAGDVLAHSLDVPHPEEWDKIMPILRRLKISGVDSANLLEIIRRKMSMSELLWNATPA
ncbi:MAG: HDOD domain-containing protein [Candidatus Firestonebacteria bacterium]|nr:HDOD domain-containing protein [Candidatus Firestonebacteria bacterium]